MNVDGRVAVCLMNGMNLIGLGDVLGPGTGWSPNRVGDYSGDGKTDILWTHTNGSIYMWLMNGELSSSAGMLLGAGSGWTPAP